MPPCSDQEAHEAVVSVWRVVVPQSSGQGPAEDEDVLENREL